MESDDDSDNKGRLRLLNNHLGSRIRSRRKHLGMSQTDLGRKLGMTFQQVQKYENGSNRIAAALLNEIAGVLGVYVDYFYEGAAGQADAARRPTGLAEAQEEFLPGTNSRPDQAETSELVRAYSRIPDPAVRERIVALLKVLQPDKD